jgi:drug/metabolite transporter (DMT)-like permease
MNVAARIRDNWAGLGNLAIVYVVWGSTYLAIRVAVREGAGIPPFTLGAVRLSLAGIILLLWTRLRKKPVRLSRRDLTVLFFSGTLMWTIGNGLVAWSEQRVESSLAALIIASSPLWAAFIEALLDRRPPGSRLFVALLIGFIGTALLTFPSVRRGSSADLWSLVALNLATVSWAAGSILQNRKPVSSGSQVSSGYQQLFAGIGLGILAIATNEPVPHPTPAAWAAGFYLLVFGSLFAFTAYVNVLQMLPLSVVMTHAYVNPVIAVILGALILDEQVSSIMLAGAALVLVGVAGVFRERLRPAH